MTDKLLHQLYYVELNMDGMDGLYRKAKLRSKTITKDEVKEWLQKQSTHQQTAAEKTIGKQELKPIYAEDIYSFQIDLTFLPSYKSSNDDNYVLFTGININTRYAYASYAKDKKTDTIIKMLEDFLKNAAVISSITTDSGSEFTNNKVKKWFEDNNITMYYVVGDSHKLGIINRFHRTLKSKMLKYFVASGTTKWIDKLQTIIKNYNNTYNTGIGYTPKQASNPLITSYLINEAIDKTKEIEKSERQFKVGDKCRIFKDKKLFDKMQTNFSEVVYTIVKVNSNTVDVEYNNEIFKSIKKKYVKLVKDVENDKPLTHKEETELKAKVTRLLDSEALDLNNIQVGKRIRAASRFLD
jgi:hypothetical protein